MEKNLALLGCPVDFSLSPALFRVYREALGSILYGGRVPGAKYLLVEVGEAVDLIPLFQRFNLLGVNVTRPLKEALSSQLTALTDEARACGAVNCIRLQEGRLQGHNSDVAGVRAMLQPWLSGGINGPVYLLGAGGAARSVVVALKGASLDIRIANRTAERGEHLAKQLGVHAVPWVGGLQQLPANSLLISTLPHKAELPPIDWPHVAAVCDSCYTLAPFTSRVAKESSARGLPYSDGWPWLMAQALEAYRFFGYQWEIPFGLFAQRAGGCRIGHRTAVQRVMVTGGENSPSALEEGVIYEYRAE